MKIGLKNAIRTVHGTIGADMKYLVFAACIMTGSGTFAYKSPFVPGQKKGFFTKADRVTGFKKHFINHIQTVHINRSDRNPAADDFNHGIVCNRLINIEVIELQGRC